MWSDGSEGGGVDRGILDKADAKVFAYDKADCPLVVERISK